MKKLLFITILLLSVNVFSQHDSGWLGLHAHVMPLDKQKHVVGGGLASIAGYGFARKELKQSRFKSVLIGVGTSLLAGTFKELMDSGQENNKFDLEDLAYTVGGGILVTVTFDQIVNLKWFKKKNDKN